MPSSSMGTLGAPRRLAPIAFLCALDDKDVIGLGSVGVLRVTSSRAAFLVWLGEAVVALALLVTHLVAQATLFNNFVCPGRLLGGASVLLGDLE